MDIEGVFERVAPAIVGVQAGPGLGSGFFVDARGLCVTNRHVVGAEPEVVLALHDTTEVRGKVVRSVRSLDLAFILADVQQVPALPVATPETVRVGQEVIAIGHPRGLTNTVTRGIVSSLGRLINGTSWLQTDAAINPGNSGGPLVSANGEVIAVSTMIMSGTHGIGFGLPAAPLRHALGDVAAHFDQLTTLKYCNVCGASNLSGVKYCETCGDGLEGKPVELDRMQRRLLAAAGGAPIAASWKCTACKQAGETAARPRYCPRCGATL